MVISTILLFPALGLYLSMRTPFYFLFDFLLADHPILTDKQPHYYRQFTSHRIICICFLLADHPILTEQVTPLLQAVHPTPFYFLFALICWLITPFLQTSNPTLTGSSLHTVLFYLLFVS